MEALVSEDEEFFRYVDETSPESCAKAVMDLEAYVLEAGPFDAVMGFSEGAAIAASLMIHKLQQDPRQQMLNPLFKCAVFFSGGVPVRSGIEPKESLQLVNASDTGMIEIPTAHIWGGNDRLYPTFGPVLSQLCRKDRRAVFIHKGGHEIPSSKSPEEVAKVVRLINKTIEKSMTLQ